MTEFKVRLQLKSDTEENWKTLNDATAGGFIPLSGELIIYTADNTHSYCRLKVGDGSTNIVSLPFIDAGTINGKETTKTEVSKITHWNSGIVTSVSIDGTILKITNGALPELSYYDTEAVGEITKE